MSNHNGKPFEPFDLSAYAPEKGREASVLDPAALDTQRRSRATEGQQRQTVPTNEGRGGGDQVGAHGPADYAARAALRPEVAGHNSPVDLDLAAWGRRSQSPPKPQSQPKLKSSPGPAGPRSTPRHPPRPTTAEADVVSSPPRPTGTTGRTTVDLARLESSLLAAARRSSRPVAACLQVPARVRAPSGPTRKARVRAASSHQWIRVPPCGAPAPAPANSDESDRKIWQRAVCAS